MIKNILFMAIVAIGLFACNSDKVIEQNIRVMKTSPAEASVEETISIEQRFETAKQLATFHGEGLHYAYEKLLEIQNSQPEYFQMSSWEEKIILYSEIVVEYINGSEIIGLEEEFEGKFPLSFESNPELVIYFDEIMSNIAYELENHLDINNTETAFLEIMNSAEFLSFQESEQNQILLSFAIFLDSFNYWNYSLYKWNNVFGNEEFLPEGPIIPVELDGLRLPKWLKNVLYIANVDGRDGTIGVIAGGASGAVAGAASVGVASAVAGSLNAAISRINDNEAETGILNIHGNQHPEYILRYLYDENN